MSNRLPATRAEAQREHSAHYLTGKPCKHGHVSPRYTSTGACIICVSLTHSHYRKAHLLDQQELDNPGTS